MVPCQDTPSNKIKYTADVTVNSPLTALMSATPTGEPSTTNNETTFKFVQDVPIPVCVSFIYIIYCLIIMYFLILICCL